MHKKHTNTLAVRENPEELSFKVQNKISKFSVDLSEDAGDILLNMLAKMYIK